MLDLAIIVLNFKTPELVIDCLASLEGQLIVGRHETVVVDNCSGDNSVARIESAIAERGWSGWARVVPSQVNGGFAAGNNVGIQACPAATYLLLNSDTLVRKQAIEVLLETLATHPEIDVLSPRLEWPDGEHQISTFRYRTPVSELLYASGLGLLFRMFRRHDVARHLDEFTLGLQWVSFACVAIRRETLQSVGLLDERYFMYYEDMAFCRSAVESGAVIAYQPAARVVHLRGGSSPVKALAKKKKRLPRYYYASRAHYFQTFYGRSGLLAANLLWTLGWMLGKLRLRSPTAAGAHRDIWCSPRRTAETSPPQ